MNPKSPKEAILRQVPTITAQKRTKTIQIHQEYIKFYVKASNLTKVKIEPWT